MDENQPTSKRKRDWQKLLWRFRLYLPWPLGLSQDQAMQLFMEGSEQEELLPSEPD